MLENTTSITLTALCPCGLRRHVAAFPLRDMSRSSSATFGSSLHAPPFFQHVRLSVDQRPSAVKKCSVGPVGRCCAVVSSPAAHVTVCPFSPFFKWGDKTCQNVTKSDIPTFQSCSADILVCGFPGHSCPVFPHDETKELDFLTRDKVRLVAPSGPTEIQTTLKARRGRAKANAEKLTN